MFFYYYKSNKIKHIYYEQKKKKLQKEKEQTQKELINSVLHLEKKNEILNELKEKLLVQNKEQHATINNAIFKTIDAGLAIDDDFEKFKNNFNTIYPDFFNRLQEKANLSLTQLDLKYCGFILMKVTNKEMASQMNVEPKSIRMARYRIKQKLQLSKEEDLDEFIQSAK
jgi:DNA-binding CsgD family transcriptional regulator